MAFEFFYFDIFKNLLESNNHLNISKNTNYLISGCFAGGFAYTTVYPIDFCRVMYTINVVPKEIPIYKVFFYI